MTVEAGEIRPQPRKSRKTDKRHKYIKPAALDWDLSSVRPVHCRFWAQHSPEWALACDTAFVEAMIEAGHQPVAGFKRATPIEDATKKKRRRPKPTPRNESNL